jgi:hypothetical protein
MGLLMWSAAIITCSHRLHLKSILIFMDVMDCADYRCRAEE